MSEKLWLLLSLVPIAAAFTASSMRPGPTVVEVSEAPAAGPCEDLRVIDLQAERERLRDALAARVLRASQHEALLDEATAACGIERASISAWCEVAPCLALSTDPVLRDARACAPDPRIALPVATLSVTVRCGGRPTRREAVFHDVDGSAASDLDLDWLRARAEARALELCP